MGWNAHQHQTALGFFHHRLAARTLHKMDPRRKMFQGPAGHLQHSVIIAGETHGGSLLDETCAGTLGF